VILENNNDDVVAADNESKKRKSPIRPRAQWAWMQNAGVVLVKEKWVNIGWV
jgi:hypothetical protein